MVDRTRTVSNLGLPPGGVGEAARRGSTNARCSVQAFARSASDLVLVGVDSAELLERQPRCAAYTPIMTEETADDPRLALRAERPVAWTMFWSATLRRSGPRS